MMPRKISRYLFVFYQIKYIIQSLLSKALGWNTNEMVERDRNKVRLICSNNMKYIFKKKGLGNIKNKFVMIKTEKKKRKPMEETNISSSGVISNIFII